MPPASLTLAAPRSPVADPDIVRRFITWAQRADSEGRAEAASALARAYLYSDLSPAMRAEATIGMTALLDDSSSLVRRALAEALASASEAPRHIVVALACDQSDVATVVLGRSPILTDADLVDCAAIGDIVAQTALARRPHLSLAVSAALAEIGGRDAALAFIGNPGAEVSESVLRRAFERYHDDAEIREALIAHPETPARLRADLVAATARALADFVTRTQWLSQPRAERIVRDARDQALTTIALSCDPQEREGLVRHLREGRTLTVALLLRGLLSGERTLFIEALAELAGQPRRRVAAFVRDWRGAGFAALYAKAGLPGPYLTAFRAALGAIEKLRVEPGEELLAEPIERTIAACEKRGDPALAKVLSLLWRFAGEATRGKARAFAHEALVAPAAPFLLQAIEVGDDARARAGAAPMIESAIAREGGEAAPPVELAADLDAAA